MLSNNTVSFESAVLSSSSNEAKVKQPNPIARILSSLTMGKSFGRFFPMSNGAIKDNTITDN